MSLRRIFFTKEDDLDLGWLVLVTCIVFGLFAFVMEASGRWKITPYAWTWFGSFTTLSFIAGAAISRARLIAGSQAAASPFTGSVLGSYAAPALPDPHLEDDPSAPDPRAP